MTQQQNSSISSFKKLVRQILIPLLIAVAIFSFLGDAFITGVLVKKAQLSHSFKISKLIGPKSGLNAVPIFGPSMARNAYYCDSLSTNANYYNYAMENAGFFIVELLLKMECQKEGKETPIIIDYHYRFLEPDTSENKRTININTYLPFVIKENEVRTFLKENNRLRPHHNFPGIRFFGAYTEYGKDLFAEFFHPRKEYHRGGVFNKKAPPTEQFDRLVAYREAEGPKTFMRNPDFEARLDKIIADNPNRTFILVGSTRHYSVMDMLKNYEDMVAYADELGDRFENVKTIIFETDAHLEYLGAPIEVSREGSTRIFKVNYPDEYYKDTGHLSLQGARIFSSELREVLDDEGLLIDAPMKKRKKKSNKRETDF